MPMLSVTLAFLLPWLAAEALTTPPQQSMAEWRRIAQPAIAEVWKEMKAEAGFGYAGEMVVGSLEEGDDEYFEFDFVGHREYLIVGVCDGDCSDLDLLLYDRDDNVVLQDIEMDDYPVLVSPSGRSGVHYIEAAMPSCSVEPCYYAVQVFHRYVGTR
ncbi:MAG: hypothetical protein GKS06_14495 [Acidobacteria bacterium]|nr:hypothetical protein [Acidobacteriota bacterium]